MNLLKAAKRRSRRVVDQISKKFDSVEREFNQLWPLVETIEGLLVSPEQERWLFENARALPNGATIVEIGSFKGRSTCCLAYGCRGTKKHVFAIDTFSGNEVDFRQGKEFEKGYLHEFWHNIENCGLTSYVTPFRGWSSEVAKGWNKPIDLLFIDGSHVYEDVLADFENFFLHVVPGGIVAFHDVVETWPGVLRVWEETASKLLYETGHCSTIGYGKKPSSTKAEVVGQLLVEWQQP